MKTLYVDGGTHYNSLSSHSEWNHFPHSFLMIHDLVVGRSPQTLVFSLLYCYFPRRSMITHLFFCAYFNPQSKYYTSPKALPHRDSQLKLPFPCTCFRFPLRLSSACTIGIPLSVAATKSRSSNSRSKPFSGATLFLLFSLYTHSIRDHYNTGYNSITEL